MRLKSEILHYHILHFFNQLSAFFWSSRLITKSKTAVLLMIYVPYIYKLGSPHWLRNSKMMHSFCTIIDILTHCWHMCYGCNKSLGTILGDLDQFGANHSSVQVWFRCIFVIVWVLKKGATLDWFWQAYYFETI